MNRKSIGIAVVAMMTGASAGWLFWDRAVRAREDANPYEYRLEDARSVPTGLRRYVEGPSVALGRGGAAALGVADDGTLYVGGAWGILRVSEGERPSLVVTGIAVTALGVDGEGRLLAGCARLVHCYTPGGVHEKEWPDLGAAALITSIALGSNRVFVADAGQRVVWVFDGQGRLEGQLDGRREGRSVGFVIPSPTFDVVAVPDGGVWVSNPGEQRVELYDREGAFRESWGRSGMEIDGFCGCCNPTHLAGLPGGCMVTAEKGIVRVKVLDSKGRLEAVVAGPGDFVGGAGVSDVAVDGAGGVWVLESGGDRVRRFSGQP